MFFFSFFLPLRLLTDARASVLTALLIAGERACRAISFVVVSPIDKRFTARSLHRLNIFFVQCTGAVLRVKMFRSRVSRLSTSALKQIFPSSSLPFRGVRCLINFLPLLTEHSSLSSRTFYGDVSLFTSPLLFLSVLARERNFHPAPLSLSVIRFVYARTSSHPGDLEWMDGEQLPRVQLSRHKLPWPGVVWVKTILHRVPGALFTRADSFHRFFFFFFFVVVVVVVESLLRKNGISRSYVSVQIHETNEFLLVRARRG